MPCAIILPPVIWALNAVATNLALAQRPTAMNAGVTEDMGVAGGVTESHEVEAKYLYPQWTIVGDLRAGRYRVPEIYIHSIDYNRDDRDSVPRYGSGWQLTK